MYHCWQNYTSNFRGKADVCELYYWSVSVPGGHPVGALAIICLWILLTWLTYTYGMLCQDDVAPGECLLIQCASQLFFGLGTSTHVCSWSITDRYIIKQHVSQAWCRFWTIKALIEAEVLWWLYSDLQGHSSSVDHCQTFIVFMIRLAKKPVLKAALLTLVVYVLHLWLAKRAIIERLAKILFWKKCLSVSDVHQCIVVIA